MRKSMVEPDDKERLERPLVRCLCRTYFQDKAGVWHQPGTMYEFSVAEARELESRGFLQVIETMSLEPPENRIINFKRRKKNGG